MFLFTDALPSAQLIERRREKELEQ